MSKKPVQILLIEADGEIGSMIADHLQEALWTEVTLVDSADEALREELTTRHELLICSLDLPDINSLELVRELRKHNTRSLILLAKDPSVEQAIEALRLKATDLLTKPFDLCELTEVVRRASEAEKKHRHQARRNRRLRRLSSQIIREREELQERMNLVCRDFVHAYRRLAEKVETSEHLQAKIPH